MVPFDVVTGRDYMVSQSGSVTILCESLEKFSELKPSLNEKVGSEKLFLY